ncbi:hypothetical protein [Paraburkholderia sp. J12]|uniref:hypothetical protein n=1 Tax=Paraburkholderia sp. J12 TaxID=2805432 RepID=UPI002ABE794B|nr:hypothetical protein [Paraburkholderia sp. J12]
MSTSHAHGRSLKRLDSNAVDAQSMDPRGCTAFSKTTRLAQSLLERGGKQSA